MLTNIFVFVKCCRNFYRLVFPGGVWQDDHGVWNLGGLPIVKRWTVSLAFARTQILVIIGYGAASLARSIETFVRAVHRFKKCALALDSTHYCVNLKLGIALGHSIKT